MTQLHLNSLAVAVCHVHHELLEELVDVGLSTVQDSPGQSSNWPMVSLVPSKTDFVSELFYKKKSRGTFNRNKKNAVSLSLLKVILIINHNLALF